MAKDVAPPAGRISVEDAAMDEAFLDIPDEANPAIIDARKTFLATMVGAVLFIGAVILFIL